MRPPVTRPHVLVEEAPAAVVHVEDLGEPELAELFVHLRYLVSENEAIEVAAYLSRCHLQVLVAVEEVVSRLARRVPVAVGAQAEPARLLRALG